MTLDDPIAARGFQYKHGDRPLEGYTIQRAAGRGGFGEVYYAVSDSGREVALKVVHTYEQIELRGISQCMNLKNPHLVSIFDVKYGEDGRPWVIMEFVSGPSLREMLDASPSGLGVAKSAFFLREIGKGLSYLHDCGIVHRDLKPGNIFYENGIVKIGDYGLSKTMSMSRHSGQTVAVGTLHYMAPEIGDGRYDRSIDIYAMGAMLFEMITGQVPFYGSSPAEVLMKHLSSNVDLASVEEPLKSVIAKAMAKNPADRYQSVQEMVEAVFGSEEIRNSVSQFSPASLTMVAGRAARNIGAPLPPPPGAARRNATDDPWVQAARRFEEGFQRAGRKFQEAGDRFASRMSGQRTWRYPGWHWPAPAASAGPMRPQDSIALPARIFLTLAAATVAALLVSANTGRNSSEMAMFAWLSIAGAVTGLKLAWRFMAPGLAGESHWFKRFSLGAAAFAALVLSFPTWVEGRLWHSQHVLLATFIGLCLLDWEARLTPNRKQRISVGHLFTAGILGFVLGSMFEVDETIVAATLAGASLAASLLAAHRLLRGASPIGAAPYPNNPPSPPPSGNAPETEGIYTPEPAPIPPVGNFAPFAPRADVAPAPGKRTTPRPPETWMWFVMVAGFGGVLLVFAGIARPILVPQLMPFMIVALVLISKRGGRMSSMYAAGAIPAGAFGNSDASSSIGGLFSGVARGRRFDRRRSARRLASARTGGSDQSAGTLKTRRAPCEPAPRSTICAGSESRPDFARDRIWRSLCPGGNRYCNAPAHQTPWWRIAYDPRYCRHRSSLRSGQSAGQGHARLGGLHRIANAWRIDRLVSQSRRFTRRDCGRCHRSVGMANSLLAEKDPAGIRCSAKLMDAGRKIAARTASIHVTESPRR